MIPRIRVWRSLCSRRRQWLHVVTTLAVLTVLGIVNAPYRSRGMSADIVIQKPKAKATESSPFQRVSTTLPKAEPKRYNGSAGFALAAAVQQACKSVTKPATKQDLHLFKSEEHQLLYCPVEKIGTTFLRRFLLMLHDQQGQSYKNPYDVPIDILEKTERQLGSKMRIVRHVDRTGMKKPETEDDYFKVLFTRNPYSRLVAGFVDKLVPPNVIFWDYLGTRAVAGFRKSASHVSLRHGHDVTFAEYARYVIKCHKKGTVDGHSMAVFEKCVPCRYHYDFIGKMETFGEDAMYIIQECGLNSTLETFAKPRVFKEMAAEDALNDTVFSGFSWKNQIKVISWETALKRVWLKLQMRGLIGLSENFHDYISKSEIETITAEEFRQRAFTARTRSDSRQLKQNKLQAMREAYLTLHIDEVKYIRELYMNDLKLFGYDDSPELLFYRTAEPQAPTKYFIYYNWT